MSDLLPTRAAGTSGKCISRDDLARRASTMQRLGRRIVLTNGCFDLLHPGHVEYLEEAAAEGDCLIVAVNADWTVAQLKGPGRPVMSAGERARMLAALACVDLVVIFDEPTPHAIIEIVRPDVLVKGGDYAVADVVGRELVEAGGGIVKTLGLTPGLSTSRVLERLASSVPLADVG